MNETNDLRLWVFRVGFVIIAAAIVVVNLLPLNFTPRTIAPPDVLVALALAISTRRPDYLPLWLIALVFFVIDLLLFLPPGLKSSCVVIAAGILGQLATKGDEVTPSLEWIEVAMAYVGIILAIRLVSTLALLPQVPLSLHLTQVVGTLIFYPVIVVFVVRILGIRRLSITELDALMRGRG